MADDPPPPKPRALSGIHEGLRIGLSGANAESLGDMLGRLSLPKYNDPPPSQSPEQATERQRDIQPAVAGGGEEKKPKQKKNTAGKTFLHGADRTVRYYKPTEAELDRLGELSRDEASALARMAFCLGLLVNVVLGLLFTTGLSPASQGAAIAIGVCAALGGLRFWRDAANKKADGATALEKVKSDHDFANI